ncbi:hypothetical protein M5J15_07700 [Serratia symbiotica]|uniref:hypothetical protein n=1 Tax=Serratia symbiotica TaxID=138074 RepID=UPI001DD06021|nr:hypothetical protein [Serratia symbiotica]MCX2957545.1 hypothetical protein [Serratia symbiotica]NIG87337.1 hypothetical protein [Serratia symbiotica]USS96659.1 hypothetical protein M5J15_07700 [Serratia symbiotica]
MKDKTHYRKAFDSPYLSSADIVEPIVLTISHVVLEPDKTKKTQDRFNTAYFKEKQIRQNERLKPMILNATNSKVIKKISGSSFIEDWQNLTVMIEVEHVKFGCEYVEGLRVYPAITQKKILTPTEVEMWEKAKQSYINNKSLDKVLAHVEMSQEDQERFKKECANAMA